MKWLAMAIGATVSLCVSGLGCSDGSEHAGMAGREGQGGRTGAGSAGHGGADSDGEAGGVATGGVGAMHGGGEGGTGGHRTPTGPPGTDLVSAGQRATSTNYKMNFTLGQSTQNQQTCASLNYRVRGGVQATDGSLP